MHTSIQIMLLNVGGLELNYDSIIELGVHHHADVLILTETHLHDMTFVQEIQKTYKRNRWNGQYIQVINKPRSYYNTTMNSNITFARGRGGIAIISLKPDLQIFHIDSTTSGAITVKVVKQHYEELIICTIYNPDIRSLNKQHLQTNYGKHHDNKNDMEKIFEYIINQHKKFAQPNSYQDRFMVCGDFNCRLFDATINGTQRNTSDVNSKSNGRTTELLTLLRQIDMQPVHGAPNQERGHTTSAGINRIRKPMKHGSITTPLPTSSTQPMRYHTRYYHNNINNDTCNDTSSTCTTTTSLASLQFKQQAHGSAEVDYILVPNNTRPGRYIALRPPIPWNDYTINFTTHRPICAQINLYKETTHDKHQRKKIEKETNYKLNREKIQ
jgi:hypothetical protein